MYISTTRLNTLFSTGMVLVALSTLGACEKTGDNAGKGPAEIAGKEIDKAAAVAGKELKQAAKETGVALEKAGAKLQEKVQEKKAEMAQDKVPDAVVTPAPQK